MTRRYNRDPEPLLEFIIGYWMANSYPPAIMDLVHLSGYCHSSVENDLRKLEKDGKIKRTPGVARSIVPTNLELQWRVAKVVVTAKNIDKIMYKLKADFYVQYHRSPVRDAMAGMKLMVVRSFPEMVNVKQYKDLLYFCEYWSNQQEVMEGATELPNVMAYGMIAECFSQLLSLWHVFYAEKFNGNSNPNPQPTDVAA